MRNSVLALAILLGLLSACKNAPKEQGSKDDIMTGLTDTNQLARITYQEPEFNFGEVTQGDVVKHDFHFTNTGKVPLIITIARASCGCTTPTWPKEAIPPGGTGVISAVFKTEHMLEEQTKTIWVAGNTVPNQTRVTLVGRVKSVKQ